MVHILNLSRLDINYILGNMGKINYSCKECHTIFIDYKFKKRKYCSQLCNGKKISPMKGKKHTLESIERFKQVAEEKREQISKGWFKEGHEKWDHPNVKKNWIKKGQKPVNFAGGVRSKYQKIKDDSRYHKWQKAVLLRDNNQCQDCGDRENKLDCHHLKRTLDYPYLAYDLSNGVAVCKRCHIIRHGKNSHI